MSPPSEEPLRSIRDSSLFENILEATADGLLIVAPDGTVLEYNTQFLNLWNLDDSPSCETLEDLLAVIVPSVVQPEDFGETVRKLSGDDRTETLETVELEDGRIFEQYSCPVESDGEYSARLWSFSDITKRERARKRARQMAYQDPLTNLPNRVKFLEYLQGMLLYNESSEQQAAILCLDLNRFKRINNSIGQDAGDEVLKECVDRWKSVMGDDLLMARTGGDEFMVFVPEYRDREDLRGLAEDLIGSLGEPFGIDGVEIDVRVNIGIALYPRDSEDIDGLLSMGHSAMEEAREKGFNNYEFFLSEMQDEPANIVSLEADLRQAVENDELSLFYQPQVALEDERLIGLEALLRWDHPERGMIPPKTTIPLAEETGLILPVGEWVLRNAARQLMQWQSLTDEPLRMSVNVSAEQIIQERRLLQSVNEIIEDTNIDPECLELEITETVALRDLDFTSDLLSEFQSMSIRTSVDDFGTGHSTMTYLQELPYDCLKIDRSFIDGLAEQRQNRVMVEAMISLARELGLEVIAEGVETKGQLEVLEAMGCDVVQGFYYTRPLPEGKLVPFLEREAFV